MLSLLLSLCLGTPSLAGPPSMGADPSVPSWHSRARVGPRVPPSSDAYETTEGGVRYADIVPGTGPTIDPSGGFVAEFTLWLEDLTVLDSSYKGRSPAVFTGAPGALVPGWDEGVRGMQTGGTRVFHVPWRLGYGKQGDGPIPKKSDLTFLVTLVAVFGPREAPEAPAELADGDYTVSDTGVKVHDLVVGTGPAAGPGDVLRVDYTGWLADGTEFDSSLRRPQPMVMTFGADKAIPGWEEAITGLKVGGTRQVVIPPDMGYGPAGAPPEIPPDATLIFQLRLAGIDPPQTTGAVD